MSRDPQGETRPLPAPAVRHYQSCARDEDCVVTLNGCCDCANGGVDTAIARDRVDAFRARFDCSATHCNHEGAMQPCASGEARCSAGFCQYVAP